MSEVEVPVTLGDLSLQDFIRAAARKWSRNSGFVIGDLTTPRKVPDGTLTPKWTTTAPCYECEDCFEGNGRLWQFTGKPDDSGEKCILSVRQHGVHSGNARIARKARSAEADSKRDRERILKAIEDVKSMGIKPTAVSVLAQLPFRADADIVRDLLRADRADRGDHTAEMLESEETFRNWVAEFADCSILKFTTRLVWNNSNLGIFTKCVNKPWLSIQPRTIMCQSFRRCAQQARDWPSEFHMDFGGPTLLEAGAPASC